MFAIEIVVTVLIAVLLFVTALALWSGILGSTGAAKVMRCPECGHREVVSPFAGSRVCGRCRHTRLLHPVETVRRSHFFGHFPHH